MRIKKLIYIDVRYSNKDYYNVYTSAYVYVYIYAEKVTTKTYTRIYWIYPHL